MGKVTPFDGYNLNGFATGSFRVTLCLCFKTSLRAKLYENEFDLHEKGYVGKTHFHMNGFARRLVFTQRQKATRKWRIIHLQSWSGFLKLPKLLPPRSEKSSSHPQCSSPISESVIELG